MLKLKTLTLRNFLSIGNVTQALRLDDEGLTLVLGNNTDSNGGTTKNGAGKTALLQALSFALYGTPLTKIKVDNLINNINQKGMLVTLDFEVDGREYRIERGRKPNILKFFVNGEEIEDMSRGENRETQSDITDIVGMSQTMFTHIIALNTYTIPFLRQRAADQREVSEELLGVTQISTRAETLKKLIAATKDSLRQEEANIKAMQEANSRIENEIAKATKKKEEWDITHHNWVTDMASQIEELSVIDFDAQKAAFDSLDEWKNHQRDLASSLQTHANSLKAAEDNLAGLTSEIDKLERTDPRSAQASNRDRIARDIVRKRQEITKLEARKESVEGRCAAVQAKIDDPGEHQCVTCAQPLVGTDHLATVMSNLEKEKSAFVSEVEGIDLVIGEIEQEISILEEAEAESTKQEEADAADHAAALLSARDKLTAVNSEFEAAKQAIRDAKDGMASDEDMPDTLFESRDELYAVKHMLDTCVQELERDRVKENPFIQHLDSLRETLQSVDFEDINRLTDLFRHQDFLMKLLTNKESFVRKKIIDQNLYYLNTRLNAYLEKLGLPHEVVFQNDLTVDITLLGRDFDFEQLSRGEMNRVIMAVSWAFRDVWESLNHTVNLVWVDELLDTGMDSAGAEAGLTVLKSFSRNLKNVFLISHRDELVGRIDRTLLVSKQNGFTTIDENLT